MTLSPGAQSPFFSRRLLGHWCLMKLMWGFRRVAQAIAEKCTNSVNATKFFVSLTNPLWQQWQTATQVDKHIVFQGQ